MFICLFVIGSALLTSFHLIEQTFYRGIFSSCHFCHLRTMILKEPKGKLGQGKGGVSFRLTSLVLEGFRRMGDGGQLEGGS